MPVLSIFNDVRTNRECNILFMGVTGVGKSTYLNSIANYCLYRTYDDALKYEPKILIPSQIIYTDEDYEEHTFRVGDDSKTEKTDTAKSSTQYPQVYSFKNGNITFNIIDVPGIGDTDGVDKDKINMNNIFRLVTEFDEIHHICILVKSSDNVLTKQMKYSLNEILLHFHRSVKDNIAFILTHTRGTDYQPGSSLNVLQSYCKELKEEHNIEINADENTVFCIDSEAFKGQCLNHFKNINENLEGYRLSWDKSYESTIRLLRKALNCQPINVNKNMTIDDTKTIIELLIKPLATITTLIQDNQQNFEKIKDFLEVKEYVLHLIPLDKPRMVCASSTCLGVNHGRGGVNLFDVYYRQICHEVCHLQNTKIASFPEPELNRCTIMNNGHCTNCGCSWDNHMHILYNQKMIYEKSKINEKLKDLTTEKKEAEIRKIKTKLEDENRTILDIVAKFIHYLKNNAIMGFNDAYEEYLNIEKKTAESNNDTDKVRCLNNVLQEFQEKKNFYENQLRTNRVTTISYNDVDRLKDELFNLELNGEKIKQMYHFSVGTYVKYVKNASIQVDVTDATSN